MVIIGASAAGLSAAIYAARRNLKFVIITKNLGGEVALSGVVNNWPGQIETNGFKLAQDFINHVKSYNTQIDEGLEIKSLKAEKNWHLITAMDSAGQEKIYQTKTIIIASGIHPRRLDIPGEKEFYGKGVTYCTTCDGPLYKNKITATIGAGNSALESALMMADIAKKIYLITKYPNDQENNFGFPRGENILIEKVKNLSNLEIIYNAQAKEILVDKLVTGLKYLAKTDKQEKIIEVQGIMIHVGMTPNSDFADLNKNKAGEIEIDLKCHTSIPGIFAAGDVTNVPYKQIVVASGQGVTAALSAIEYLNQWHEK